MTPCTTEKAVEAGHLDVEEDEIGLVRLDRADRLAAVGAGLDDLDIVMAVQAQLEPLDGKALVVDENGTNGHAATFGWSSTMRGMSMMTEKPPSAVERVSMV